MIVLGIDTSLPACSVAVLDRDHDLVLAAESEPMPVGHAEMLMPMVERCLNEAGIQLVDIDLFAATVGPGSFTGVRVGVATIRGFALATGRPAVGVTTLQALAETAREAATIEQPFAVAIDARRDEIYLQCFAADGAVLSDPAVLRLDEAVAALPAGVSAVFGSGARLLADRAGTERPLAVIGEAVAPSARSVAACARPDGPVPRPFYLRAPDAKPQGDKMLARR